MANVHILRTSACYKQRTLIQIVGKPGIRGQCRRTHSLFLDEDMPATKMCPSNSPARPMFKTRRKSNPFYTPHRTYSVLCQFCCLTAWPRCSKGCGEAIWTVPMEDHLQSNKDGDLPSPNVLRSVASLVARLESCR